MMLQEGMGESQRKARCSQISFRNTKLDLIYHWEYWFSIQYSRNQYGIGTTPDSSGKRREVGLSWETS
jgi:hypothetical protein